MLWVILFAALVTGQQNLNFGGQMNASVVVVLTTETALTTTRVLPMPTAAMPPFPPTPSVAMMPPLQTPSLPQIISSPMYLTATVSQVPLVTPVPVEAYNASCPLFSGLPNFIISSNYSAIFHLESTKNSTDEKGIDVHCEAAKFCSDKSPGLYCYRPAKDKCIKSVPKLGQAVTEEKECLSVAILSCPDGVFIGCAEGFACHQDPEPWPWDKPLSERLAYMALPSQVQLSYQQNMATNMSQPILGTTSGFSGNTSMNGGMNPNQPMAAAHCYAVFKDQNGMAKLSEAALMPSSPQDWTQWCAYRTQLKVSKFSVTVGADCVTRTLQGAKIAEATESCPEEKTMQTVWWWPGIESGAPPNIAKVAESTTSSDPCVPTPPPTCNGPYPYAPRPTTSLLFVSVSTTSVMQTTTLYETQPAASTTLFETKTVPGSTVYITQTLPASTITVIDTAAAAVSPLVPPAEPATPVEPAKAASAVAQPAKVAPEAFPKAGEPYTAYTAKIAAIATVV